MIFACDTHNNIQAKCASSFSINEASNRNVKSVTILELLLSLSFGSPLNKTTTTPV